MPLMLTILASLLLSIGCTPSPAGTPTLQERSVKHQGHSWRVVQIDTRAERLELVGGKPGEPHTLAALGPARVAMNAGMYMSDLRPVGLLVQEGEQISKMEMGPGGGGNFFLKPNGVFSIGQDGAAVTESTEWVASPAKGVRIATQSGPLLVHRGALHPGLNPASTSTYTRNGVCAQSSDTVLLFISEWPVSLWQAASFARDGLGCQDALYLDGAVSMLHTEQGTIGKRWGEWGAMLVVR